MGSKTLSRGQTGIKQPDGFAAARGLMLPNRLLHQPVEAQHPAPLPAALVNSAVLHPHPAFCVGDFLLDTLQVVRHDLNASCVLLHNQIQRLQLLLQLLQSQHPRPEVSPARLREHCIMHVHDLFRGCWECPCTACEGAVAAGVFLQILVL
jgi:hypothetical protein